jgi:hypothetical protein
LLVHHENNTNALVNSHGSANCGENFWQLWENVAQSSDMDSAKQYAIQATRFMTRQMVATTDITAQNLKMYAKHLKHVIANLEDEEEAEEQDG